MSQIEKGIRLKKDFFDLSGHTAVVIGGTSGVGYAIALALAQAGADTVATGRRKEEVHAVTEEIQKVGRRSLAITCDVRDRASIAVLASQIKNELSAASILVNSAGITERGATLNCTEESWNRILDINLTGMFRACQIFAPDMVKAGYGRIINIASLSSFVAFHEVAAYSASKSGVASLTRSLAVELSRHGVCVNAIAPGIFPTALNSDFLSGSERGRELLMRTPMGRFGRVEELGGAAVFLASEEASFISGTVLTVDGGFMASGVNQ
jgi:NAD(P)-dependent dehydrogenase (short-subunit alcohol dehydrogenase family)